MLVEALELLGIVILRFIPRTTPDYTHKMAGLSKHMAPSMQWGLSRTTNPTGIVFFEAQGKVISLSHIFHEHQH